MYIPACFAQNDTAVITEFLRANSFALLISSREEDLIASHVPLLYEPRSGAPGVLYGHLARANPHSHVAEGPVLAVFSGAHAYISPTWYRDEHLVPTWNYAAVHVYGKLTVINEGDDAIEILRRLVEFYEMDRPRPWTFDPTSDWTRDLAKAIVAFRIDVSKVEAKWKLSQNRSDEQRQRVIAALEASAESQAVAVAQLMRETPDRRP